VVLRDGQAWKVQAAGPTTSMRQEPYMPEILKQYRVRLIIGKGGMGEATRKACARYGCAYLQAVGGAGAVIARAVEEVAGVHFIREFGPTEALWELRVKDLPAVVTMDAHGRSLHRRIANASRRVLSALLPEDCFGS
jgi:fumarate hydratase class I